MHEIDIFLNSSVEMINTSRYCEFLVDNSGRLQMTDNHCTYGFSDPMFIHFFSYEQVSEIGKGKMT